MIVRGEIASAISFLLHKNHYSQHVDNLVDRIQDIDLSAMEEQVPISIRFQVRSLEGQFKNNTNERWW